MKFATAFLLFLLVLPIGVKAQGNQNRNERFIENICDRTNTRIETIISRYDNQKQKHIARYQHIKQKLSEIVSRLNTHKLNTDELVKDLQRLDELTVQFAANYAKFVSELRAAQQFACGKSEGQFKSKLESARSQLKLARENSIAARELIRTELREDLQNLKKVN